MKYLITLLLTSVSLLYTQGVDSLFYGNSKLLQKNPYGWGYMAGTNGYTDIGKYQRFDVQEPINVVGAKFWMGIVKPVNTPDTITIVFKKIGYGKAYYDSLSGGPGTTITSIKTTIAAFDTGGKGTAFMIPSPFNMTGSLTVPESVFVGIEWSSAADDTFALFADSAKQGGKLFRAWEKLTGTGYTYQRFNEPSNYSWGFDGDLWIALLYKKGLLSVQDEPQGASKNFLLEQNFPNPFNPNTNISFSISTGAFVSLKVFDILGNEVASLVNEHLETGRYSTSFSARTISSGIYFYQLRTGNVVETRKMILMK